jgi:cytochrome P450
MILALLVRVFLLGATALALRLLWVQYVIVRPKMGLQPSASRGWLSWFRNPLFPVLGVGPLLILHRRRLAMITLEMKEKRRAEGRQDLRADPWLPQDPDRKPTPGVGLCSWSWSCFHPFLEPDVAVLDPACLEHVLKTHFERYQKGRPLKFALSDLLGGGIFNSDAHAWKIQRSAGAHMFKGNTMRSLFVEVFRDHMPVVVDKFDAAARSGSSIDTQDLFMRFTLDTIGQIALGRNINSLDKDVPFSRAFNTAQFGCEARIISVPLISYFRERTTQRALAQLDEFAYQVVDERIAERESGALDRLRGQNGRISGYCDLLTRYVLSVDEQGRPFSREYLRDTVMNFMIAGRDTTGVTLGWLSMLFAQNPDVQRQAYREVCAEIGDPTSIETSAVYDALKKCRFLEACVKETLRLYPAVPINIKEAVDDDVLPCGMRIPRGATISWATYFMGRYSEFWEEPFKFDPDRWIRGDPCLVHPYQWLPFQGGPRQCLGMRMVGPTCSRVHSRSALVDYFGPSANTNF